MRGETGAELCANKLESCLFDFIRRETKIKGKLTRRQLCILKTAAAGTEIDLFCPPSQSYQNDFTANC